MLLRSEREALVRHARRLRADGLAVGTSGNLSARAGELVAVTPSGLDYERLTPELVCVVALDGDPVEAELAPSTELPLHLAVYGASDAAAVVHAHPPYATALSLVAGELPAVHYLIADLGGAVRVAPYARPGSEELAAAALDGLAGRSAVLLANHGTLTTGGSVERAYGRAVTLEWLAALYLRARLLGAPALLPDEEVERLRAVMETYGSS